MKNKIPPKINIEGNLDVGRRYLGIGSSQLNNLARDMSHQNLKQGARTVKFDDGTVLTCTVNNGIRNVFIFTPTRKTDSIDDMKLYDGSYKVVTVIFGSPEQRLKYILQDKDVKFDVNGEDVNCLHGYLENHGQIAKANDVYLYGDFNTICLQQGAFITGVRSTASGEVIDCLRMYFRRKYKYYDIHKGQLEESVIRLNGESAFDDPPLSNTSCDSGNKITNWWSKTYNDFIAVAYEFIPVPATSSTPLQWSVNVSYKNKIVLNSSDIGEFARDFAVSTSGTNTRSSHIGFDLWGIENIFNPDRPAMYFAIMSDKEAYGAIWKFNYSTEEFDKIVSFDLLDKLLDVYNYNESTLSWHVYLIGFGSTGDHQVSIYYWDTGQGAGNNEYREYRINIIQSNGADVGSWETHKANDHVSKTGLPIGINILTAAWNPISRTLHFVTEDLPTVDDPIYVESSAFVRAWSYGYYEIGPAEQCPNGFLYQPAGFISPVTIFDGYSDDPSKVGRSFWTFGDNIAWKEYLDKVEYNSFIVFNKDNLLDKGGLEYIEKDFSSITVGFSMGLGCQDSFDPIVDRDYDAGISTLCKNKDRMDYQFLGAVMTPSGDMGYSYKEVPYIETWWCSAEENTGLEPNTMCVPKCAEKDDCPDDCYAASYEANYSGCICREYDWETKYECHEILRNSLDSTFPYDRGWRAILLNGYSAPYDFSSSKQILRNWVMYRDLSKVNGIQIVVDNILIQKDIVSIGTNRAFFKQRSFTLGEEGLE